MSSAMGFLLLGLFAFYLSIFSENLQDAKESSKTYTLQMKDYVESYLQKESHTIEINLDSTKETMLPNEARYVWLKNFSNVSNINEIIVVDTLGLVFASTSYKFNVGSWIFKSTRDSLGVEQAFSQNKSIWIDGELNFNDNQVSYHPIAIEKEKYVLILVSNLNFLYQSKDFENNILLLSIGLVIVFILMFVLLISINNRAVKAEKKYFKEQRNAFLGRTSSELAHELKNPLAIINSSAEALLRNPGSSKGPQLLSFISEEALRMSRLITNILNFRKDKVLELEKIVLYEVIYKYIEYQKEANPNICFSLQIPKELKVMTDKDQFIQICDNLIQNAIKALDSVGVIEISSEVSSKKIKLYFKDTGKGIPEEIQETCFDAFVSGSANGSGLGLAIVKDICDVLNWKIKYIRLDKSSKFNTCFEITIPKGYL